MLCKITILILLLLFSSESFAAKSAVIIAYHRFGETSYPSTNIRLEQLDKHIFELKNGPYKVLPVLEILSNLQNGNPLPDYTVGITIDDGYQSIYEEAWPRFKKAKLPFTIFVSTNSIDKRRSGRINWDQIREMWSAGVTFGAHTASHLHMTRAPIKTNKYEIIKSNSRFLSELGITPKLFAYPYGEASNEVFKVVSESGYKYAFGQHSGVISNFSNKFYLPRFALNEYYGNIERFKLIAKTLPLPISEFTPANPVLSTNNPPYVGFTVIGNLKGLSRISCFTSIEGRVSSTLLGASRVEVRMTKPFLQGRNRLNCTLPGKNGRFHWLGALFLLHND